MISRHLILAMLVLLLASTVTAQETRSCRVRYVSIDHVYLDAGEAEGLAVGTRVVIIRDKVEIAVLSVEHAARHSASCLIDPDGGDVLSGDTAVYMSEASGLKTTPAIVAPAAPRSRTRTESIDRRRSEREGPRLSGSIALQWEHVDDTSDANLDFDQPGLRFNVRVDRLNHDFVLRARGSLRHDLRSRAYAYAPEDAWRNRILEVSLARLESDADWQMAFGRVGSRVTAAVGPFDGTMVNRRVGSLWRLGAFAGLVPGWDEANQWSDDRVSGAIASLQAGDAQRGRIDLSVAAVARRRAGEIDRDYLAVSGLWQRNRLSLMHVAQIDWNRGWRRDVDDRALALSNVMISGRWRPDDSWRLSLTLDDRDRVRTWAGHSLPDSLFNDAGRRGVRAGAAWRRNRIHIGADAGLRRDDRYNELSRSYGFNFDLREWPMPGLGLGARVSGFDGPMSSGVSPSLRLQHRDRVGGLSRVSVGARSYELTAFSRRSTGKWLSLSHDHSLGRDWSLALEARWDGGDDTSGRVWFMELRRRL